MKVFIVAATHTFATLSNIWLSKISSDSLPRFYVKMSSIALNTFSIHLFPNRCCHLDTRLGSRLSGQKTRRTQALSHPFNTQNVSQILLAIGNTVTQIRLPQTLLWTPVQIIIVPEVQINTSSLSLGQKEANSEGIKRKGTHRSATARVHLNRFFFLLFFFVGKKHLDLRRLTNIAFTESLVPCISVLRPSLWVIKLTSYNLQTTKP